MPMDADDAVMAVLTEAAGEPLHWTVIVDRALRTGKIDPFEVPEPRRVVSASLASLLAAGRITKTARGTYRVATPSDRSAGDA